MSGPFPYIGGKSRIARRLIAWFPPHATYVEPFCGGAQIFFQKDPSSVEVLNDIDGELVNFLRVCQLHTDELIRWLRYAITSRRLYDLYRKQNVETLTDVQRAARFLYLQKNTYGARVRSQTYNYSVLAAGRFVPSRVADLLQSSAKRLERVQLENRSYDWILKAYDRPTTFFYCDPPYVGMPFYNFNFSDADFSQLADCLQTLRGKFLLSINDHPRARQAFGRFFVREVPVRYSLKGKDGVRELAFSNFELPDG